ncbi:MAG TPA: glycosyltransferase [Gammaproteobacteria bacterium]|nr:glycosyltransferase [Gammaproteobacteria bacterium]
METSVTVVIPAYNATSTIDICMKSLAAQQGFTGSVEVIVVDDCSTDETVKRLEYWREKLSGERFRLRILRQEKNQGPAAARNRGAQEAVGDFVLFTDADCEADSHWLAEMIRPFEDPEVSAVKGAYKTRQKELAARFCQAEFEDRYRLLDRHRYVDVVFSYSAGFRTRVFLDTGGYDPAFPVADNEDTDLSYRLATAGHRIVFNRKAIIYHHHPDTLGWYLRKKYSRAYWRMLVYKRYPEKAVADTYTPQTLKLEILLAAVLLLSLLLSLWIPASLWVSAVAAAAFLVLGLSFVAKLEVPGWDLKLAAPFIMFARAVVMGAGLLAVIPRLLRKDSLQAQLATDQDSQS